MVKLAAEVVLELFAEKALIRPEKARFSRKDFCPVFSENLRRKPPFVSPRLDVPKFCQFVLGKLAGDRVGP